MWTQCSGEAYSAVAADYRGMTVGEMNELRVKAREKGVGTWLSYDSAPRDM